jgi:hypothetical protein
MSPSAKARCMRSKVTISRVTLYHMRGPLNTTIQGSHTPTQMECRHESMVGAVQSARPTVASCPVPCRQQEVHGKRLWSAHVARGEAWRAVTASAAPLQAPSQARWCGTLR